MNSAPDNLDGIRIGGVDLGEQLRALSDGGPPVDEAAVAAYVAGVLDEDSATRVAALIGTYRTWHRACCELRALVSMGEVAEQSLSVVSPPVRPTSYKRAGILAALAVCLVACVSIVVLSGESIADGDGTVRVTMLGLGGGNHIGEAERPQALALLSETPLAAPSVFDTISTAIGEKSVGANSGLLTSPLGTAVEDVRPEFEWTPVPEATQYVVHLTKAGGVPQLLTPTTKPTFKPLTPLDRGTVYTWEVVAELPDGRKKRAPGSAEARAKFYVLSKTEADSFTAELPSVSGSQLGQFSIALRYGLLDRAAEHLEELMKSNSESELLKNLNARFLSLRQMAP